MKFYTNVERFGNYMLERGYENGKPFSRKVSFSPTLYIEHSEGTVNAMRTDRLCRPKKFSTMSEAKEFLEKYSDVDGYTIYGCNNWITNYITEKYKGKIEFDLSLLNVFMFDIEVDISKRKCEPWEATETITAFSIKRSKDKKYHLLGLKDYHKERTITGIDPDDIIWEKFDNEKDMITRFIALWTSEYPDIVTGWNVDFFDIAYVVSRIVKLFGESTAKLLSPWGSIRSRSIEQFGKEKKTYSISGVTIIDYMDAFKKFGYSYGPQESYKLDNIAHVVLGEKKVSYEEYSSLSDLFEKNPHLYYDYALKDTLLIQKMEDKTALIALSATIAYMGGSNFSDAFGTVNIWESILYRRMLDRGVVHPVKRGPGEPLNDLVGGFVKEPKPGMYRYGASFDLDSLYPRTMQSFNMGPDTIITGQDREIFTREDLWEGNVDFSDRRYSVCANGVKFDTSFQGIIPEIIDEFYTQRKSTKKEMLDFETELQFLKHDKNASKEYIEKIEREIVILNNKQMAIKILLD